MSEYFINNNANLFYDDCSLNLKDKSNKIQSLYYLNNSNIDIGKTKNLSLKQPYIYYEDGKGWTNKKGENIDNDSKFRTTSRLTNFGEINQLQYSPDFSILSPYRDNYQNKLESIDLESGNRIGDNTSMGKIKSHINNHEKVFIPMIDRVKEFQKVDNIVPENNWIRGGKPTRDLARDPGYLKSQGYQYNGKFWYK